MNISRIPELLGVKYPVILGVVGAEHVKLAAAVSEAGGLGVLHGGKIARGAREKKEMRDPMQEMKRLTVNPFSINIPITLVGKDYADALVNLAIDEGIKAVTTSAGSARTYTERLKKANIKVLHVVATVNHAVKAMEAGVDVVIASGIEAGGWQSREEVTTFALIPQVVDAIKGRIPVVAAGGIGDARGILAAFSLGAEGVQVGTRFLASIEASLEDDYKEAIIRAGDNSTEIIGRGERPARNWTLDFLNEVRPGYTRPKAGPRQSAGQVAGMVKEILSVEEIMRQMVGGISVEYARLSKQLTPFMPD
ncbi:NAD(P)H-dependent flavin oxidoreductase [Chloroflexota bacterium]